MKQPVLKPREVAAELRRQGWKATKGRGAHTKWTPPGGLRAGQMPIVISAGTANSHEHLSCALRKDLLRFGRAGENVLAAFQPIELKR